MSNARHPSRRCRHRVAHGVDEGPRPEIHRAGEPVRRAARPPVAHRPGPCRQRTRGNVTATARPRAASRTRGPAQPETASRARTGHDTHTGAPYITRSCCREDARAASPDRSVSRSVGISLVWHRDASRCCHRGARAKRRHRRATRARSERARRRRVPRRTRSAPAGRSRKEPPTPPSGRVPDHRCVWPPAAEADDGRAQKLSDGVPEPLHSKVRPLPGRSRRG